MQSIIFSIWCNSKMLRRHIQLQSIPQRYLLSPRWRISMVVIKITGNLDSRLVEPFDNMSKRLLSSTDIDRTIQFIGAY